ncbi:hypothetical protein BGZ65_012933 [Modicella reniformis]|uniref:Transposase Tc1-like domain-containing protein n=1 Tax=Modicella reniformis TaxID=1440133 RepID=A0A9P6MLB6_9FUNG|nr:hypothetical protein BGZ65_012933 [Modicella reniformis]
MMYEYTGTLYEEEEILHFEISPMTVSISNVRKALHSREILSGVAVKKPFLTEWHGVRRLKFAKEHKDRTKPHTEEMAKLKGGQTANSPDLNHHENICNPQFKTSKEMEEAIF